MIDYDLIYEAIFDAVSPIISPLPLIRDVQSDLKPADKYSAYRIIRQKRIGRQQQYASNIDGTYDVHQTYSITIKFKFVGENAAFDAAKLHMKLQRPSVLDSFEQFGLFFYNLSEVRDLPRLVSTGYEDQSTFELEFYTVVVDQDSPGYIEFVELEETIKNENNQTIIQNTQIIDLVP